MYANMKYFARKQDGGRKVVKMDSNFEIFNATSRGRGIRSKVRVNKGDTILFQEPHVFVSRSEMLGRICDNCLSMGDIKLQRCSACKMVYYCGENCHRNAWATHKLECKYLKKFSAAMPSDTVRMLSLLLLKKDTPKWLDDLVSHSEHIRSKKGDVFAYMLKMLDKYFDGGLEWSNERVFELFCKVNCNAFTICDGELKPIGLGLYQTAAFLNHSCEPNCIAVFIGATCHIRNIKNVEQDQELFISYTELMRPRAVRQDELREQYYFDCACPRCVNELEYGSEMNSLKCLNRECPNAVGFSKDTMVCSECGSTVPTDFASGNITQLYEKIEATLSTFNQATSHSENLSKELNVLEQLLTDVDAILHSQNYKVLKIVDKISDICIGMGLWNKAIYYCKRSLDSYLKFYAKYHPSTAIQLYRIGKLEVYLDMLDAGISTLSQARALLTVCYGKNHALTTQLNELLVKTVQEKYMSEQHPAMIEQR
ncbi:histone-lysine N-methyltransferase SMYD3-like [Dendronephthya gigantea]|uniref:histone-lysine N-methyltransferase SMYD3-like n=1 Tax=Dendronephthya gigantea TaxID=151771 RepID=UPI00106CB9A3|nr:histone-lysine N-methyltransferase SMYD3-like [Dendronephthya gigantea]